MPLRSDWSGDNCPIARTLDVVGDPWIVLILREAFTGSRRFEQFRDNLGVAHNVLSNRLRAMVDAGLLHKVPYRAERRTHQEYVLTESGADLLPVLHALARWGLRHTEGPGVGLAVVHRTCGRELSTVDFCPHCSVPLTAPEVTWRRPGRTPEVTELSGAH